VKPLTSILAVVGLTFALSACSNTDPMNPLGYQPESKENLLADSGFKKLSLNTPAKLTAFKKLPPHRISQTTFKGKPVWVYPDQNVCGCLYVGSQTAYNTFIKKVLNWEPNTTLDAGLKETYDWISTQYEARKVGRRVVE